MTSIRRSEFAYAVFAYEILLRSKILSWDDRLCWKLDIVDIIDLLCWYERLCFAEMIDFELRGHRLDEKKDLLKRNILLRWKTLLR
jgi:hypothetical protein